VEADSLNAFKNRLDKYWTNQDVAYDYKSDLKGTGGLPVCAVCYNLLFEMRAQRSSCARNITDIEEVQSGVTRKLLHYELLNFTEFGYGPYFAVFRRICARCRRKTIVSLPRFPNLLLIVYDHINTICAIIQRVQRLFRQNKLR